jgi:hypothetical protein
MNKQDAYVLRSISAGMAWPTLLKILEECVSVEEKSALSSDRKDAEANVMRAQGARALYNRFVAAAEQASEPAQAESE